MKKYLKLSVLPLLLSAVLFCSCKDDEKGGNPNPIINATVQNAKVTLDQANKRIDVLFYEHNTLSAVVMKFDFAPGASLYTPLMMNPATLDLSSAKKGSTIVVQTGGDLISYDVFGAVDYPLMELVATADNDQVTGRVVINQNARQITVEFDNVVDPAKIKCAFTVSPEGGELISVAGKPATNPAVLDMTKAFDIVAKSTKGGTVTYKVKPVETAATSIVPENGGWVPVQDVTLPSHMALYKTADLFENESYVLVADKRAKFGVMSNGFNFLTKMPDFYKQDPTAAAMINGSATDNLIVVNGQVVNQGAESKPVAFGTSATGTVLIGKNWNVTWNKVKFGDTVAYNAMFATTMLINQGTKQTGLDAKTKAACSAIGVTPRGYYVFFVCSQYATPGITPVQMSDIMAEWNSYYAVALQGGSGSCLLAGGKRTIYSSKVDGATGLNDKDYYKPLGCVGVLR